MSFSMWLNMNFLIIYPFIVVNERIIIIIFCHISKKWQLGVLKDEVVFYDYCRCPIRVASLCRCSQSWLR